MADSAVEQIKALAILARVNATAVEADMARMQADAAEMALADARRRLQRAEAASVEAYHAAFRTTGEARDYLQRAGVIRDETT